MQNQVTTFAAFSTNTFRLGEKYLHCIFPKTLFYIGNAFGLPYTQIIHDTEWRKMNYSYSFFKEEISYDNETTFREMKVI